MIYLFPLHAHSLTHSYTSSFGVCCVCVCVYAVWLFRIAAALARFLHFIICGFFAHSTLCTSSHIAQGRYCVSALPNACVAAPKMTISVHAAMSKNMAQYGAKNLRSNLLIYFQFWLKLFKGLTLFAVPRSLICILRSIIIQASRIFFGSASMVPTHSQRIFVVHAKTKRQQRHIAINAAETQLLCLCSRAESVRSFPFFVRDAQRSTCN